MRYTIIYRIIIWYDITHLFTPYYFDTSTMRRWGNLPTNKSPTNGPIAERGAVDHRNVLTNESADLSIPRPK